MRKIVLGLFLVMLLGSINTCQAKSKGSTTATFLKLGVGARAVGMGGAFAAVSNDINTLYWNPSGVANIKETQFTFMYNRCFMDTKQGLLGIVKKAKGIGNIGISTLYTIVENIDKTTDNHHIEDIFNATDLAISLSIGKKINSKFNIGSNFKIITANISNVSASGIALDLGVLYSKKNYSLGCCVQNIGSKIRYQEKRESLPLNFKIGNALNLLNKKLLLTLDINKPIDNKTNICLGSEYLISNSIFIRTGYNNGRNEAGNGWTMGIGIEYKNFNLDISYVPYGELGNMLRTSFTTKLK
ncbi:MAG: PorV/PorQ family protein [bacterium]|nr:PorV/PorQ family protein [bacterium]